MPELRWALIGLGALFVVVLALWEWRRGRRRGVHTTSGLVTAEPSTATGEDWRRIEPRIDDLPPTRAAVHSPDWDEVEDLQEVPVIHPAEPVVVSVSVSAESAVDVPAAARPTISAAPVAKAATPEIRWPPDRADRLLTLRVASAQGALLAGRQIRLALEQAGMVHGPQCIYHRIDERGTVLASAANMLRPGDLDPLHMDEVQFRGLSMFSVLPGPLPPVRMLEELVSLARAVAWRLGAEVQDDHGAELDGERLVKLRQSLPEGTGHEES